MDSVLGANGEFVTKSVEEDTEAEQGNAIVLNHHVVELHVKERHLK